LAATKLFTTKATKEENGRKQIRKPLDPVVGCTLQCKGSDPPVTLSKKIRKHQRPCPFLQTPSILLPSRFFVLFVAFVVVNTLAKETRKLLIVV